MNYEDRLRGSHLDSVLYKCCYAQDWRTHSVVAEEDGRPPQLPLPCVLSSSVHVGRLRIVSPYPGMRRGKVEDAAFTTI